MKRPETKDFRNEETHVVDYYEYFRAMSRYADTLEDRLKRAEGEVEFTKCVFDGAPPTGYEDWGTWASSKPKMGVFIRALKGKGETPRLVNVGIGTDQKGKCVLFIEKEKP